MSQRNHEYDAVVVGGGPAGLSAALQLGRARRRTLLLDEGRPRNSAATRVNGLLGLDGTPPAEVRAAARRDLERYDEVTVRGSWAEAVTPDDEGFTVQTDAGPVTARRVVLATGVVDVLPELPGVEQFWGISVLQCPLCHGWELADGRLAFLAGSVADLDSAPLFGVWSDRLTVLTDAGFEVPDGARRQLADAGIALEERRIDDLRGQDGRLEAVRLEDGTTLECDGIFVHNEQRQTRLVEGLGLELSGDGFVKVRKDYHLPDPGAPLMETSVRGLYAAGDLTGESQDAVMATFEGTLAGRKVFFDSLRD